MTPKVLSVISLVSILFSLFAANGEVAGASGTAISNSEPSVGASIASWQAWASSVNAITTSTNWGSVANNAGCQLLSSSVVTANDAALGIPNGVIVDGMSLGLLCIPSSVQSTSVKPAYATNCPVLQYWNGASVTNGYECVGAYTSGSQGYAGAAYTYETSGSVTGHEELGTISSGCAPGSPAANGSKMTLTQNHGELVLLPVNYSDNWTATWWKGTASPYTNWGTVCGAY